ncbi:MAG: NAD(P)/FAD-dependent oxidoreductase [Betaproteobacteria bacterium]|nr:MAG: NAD(P)/FAD-dependent oxidoreductase [Betaproteobacteria bacterium]
MPVSQYDSIIVGAGLNGLAAGVVLAKAGWKVLMFESQSEPGGAVRTAEVTLPGFRHDLYATNLNGFATSQLFHDFGADLRRLGLEFVRASNAFCSVFPDGDMVGVTTDLEETISEVRRLSAADAEAWRALTERFRRMADYVFPVMRQPMPSWGTLRTLLRGTRALGTRWPIGLFALLMTSQREFVTRHFRHPKIAALWAAWGMHLDFAPEVRGGGLYGFIQCMSAQANGLHFGKGGASVVVDALARLYCELGGELRCSSPVAEIVVENGRAVGVKLSGGELIAARHGVIANTTPTVLFGKLIKAGVSRRLARKAQRYRYGPGTMMIHLALSQLPQWRNSRAASFAYVHVAPSLEIMSRAYDDASHGRLPAEPVLIVAQPTLFNASRAPHSRHVLSIQVRVLPSRLDWDTVKEEYADRLLALLERYAPGVRQQIVGRCVLSPVDLERANPNLVGGDNLSGSHHLAQQFIFRPFLGWSRYRTPVRGLYICGASTWPGAGVTAASGYLLANLLTQTADQPPSTGMSTPVT